MRRSDSKVEATDRCPPEDKARGTDEDAVLFNYAFQSHRHSQKGR